MYSITGFAIIFANDIYKLKIILVFVDPFQMLGPSFYIIIMIPNCTVEADFVTVFISDKVYYLFYIEHYEVRCFLSFENALRDLNMVPAY